MTGIQSFYMPIQNGMNGPMGQMNLGLVGNGYGNYGGGFTPGYGYGGDNYYQQNNFFANPFGGNYAHQGSTNYYYGGGQLDGYQPPMFPCPPYMPPHPPTDGSGDEDKYSKGELINKLENADWDTGWDQSFSLKKYSQVISHAGSSGGVTEEELAERREVIIDRFAADEISYKEAQQAIEILDHAIDNYDELVNEDGVITKDSLEEFAARDGKKSKISAEDFDVTEDDDTETEGVFTAEEIKSVFASSTKEYTKADIETAIDEGSFGGDTELLDFVLENFDALSKTQLGEDANDNTTITQAELLEALTLVDDGGLSEDDITELETQQSSRDNYYATIDNPGEFTEHDIEGLYKDLNVSSLTLDSLDTNITTLQDKLKDSSLTYAENRQLQLSIHLAQLLFDNQAGESLDDVGSDGLTETELINLMTAEPGGSNNLTAEDLNAAV